MQGQIPTVFRSEDILDRYNGVIYQQLDSGLRLYPKYRDTLEINKKNHIFSIRLHERTLYTLYEDNRP
jgi:hypothetical protein